MNNLDLTKPEGEIEESGDQDIHKNWILEGVGRLENKIDGIEKRVRRVEYILYSIGIAIVVLWAIVRPILQMDEVDMIKKGVVDNDYPFFVLKDLHFSDCQPKENNWQNNECPCKRE